MLTPGIYAPEREYFYTYTYAHMHMQPYVTNTIYICTLERQTTRMNGYHTEYTAAVRKYKEQITKFIRFRLSEQFLSVSALKHWGTSLIIMGGQEAGHLSS